MEVEGVTAIFGGTVIGAVDALIVDRVMRAFRRTRRRAHLLIALGILASYLAVLGACLVLASHGSPSMTHGAVWAFARFASHVGAAAAYGLVGVFAAEAFNVADTMRRAAFAVFACLVALSFGAMQIEPSAVATPATMRWELRVPFVSLALAGSLSGALHAHGLVRAYRAARVRGRAVDPVALGRMSAMAAGFLAMALSQVALLGFAEHGTFDTLSGLGLVGAIMFGAFGFSLACVATWATPVWLRKRWEVR